MNIELRSAVHRWNSVLLQEALQEPQPQALPYAATVTDAAFASEVDAGPVDVGIERGLATAPATEIANVAYSQPSQSEEVVKVDSPEPGENAPAVAEADAAAQTAENDRASDQVNTRREQNCIITTHAQNSPACCVSDSKLLVESMCLMEQSPEAGLV